MPDAARILVFTGEGKGKTTAALGLGLRARGQGLSVGIIQFIKPPRDTGESKMARACGIVMHSAGLGFLPPRDSPKWELHRDAARAGWRKALDWVRSDACEMLILDEICLAVAHGLVPEIDVIQLMEAFPDDHVLALTGRNATPAIIRRADTVTEMRCIKHGMDAGRPARKGVEL